MQPSLNNLIRIWWAFTWRVGLITIVIMFIIALILKVVLSVTGHSEHFDMWSQLAQILVSIPVAIWGFANLFTMKFNGMRLQLAPIEAPNATETSTSSSNVLDATPHITSAVSKPIEETDPLQQAERSPTTAPNLDGTSGNTGGNIRSGSA